jgi:hypothetical protein
MTAAPTIRSAPMPLCGSSVEVLTYAGTLQLVLWDQGWPEGAAGSRGRPTLSRFCDAATPGELRALADWIEAALAGRGA